jgi:pSer/pThr/pTyr-binding forkhead associated (FHA) protein
MQHRIVFKYLSGRKRGTNEVFPLPRFASELKIGRDPVCEVRFDPLADSAVSRHHASIQWSDGEPRSYTIVDLLSSNGTFVNSRRVENASPLKDGDIVEFGRGGPTARVEILQDASNEHSHPPATKSVEKMPLAVDHTMKHKIIKY